VSEGEIEELIFWRRLRNDIDEGEGTGIISKALPGKDMALVENL